MAERAVFQGFKSDAIAFPATKGKIITRSHDNRTASAERAIPGLVAHPQPLSGLLASCLIIQEATSGQGNPQSSSERWRFRVFHKPLADRRSYTSPKKRAGAHTCSFRHLTGKLSKKDQRSSGGEPEGPVYVQSRFRSSKTLSVYPVLSTFFQQHRHAGAEQLIENISLKNCG